jgi:DNA-binding response OmpR family regulator
VIQLNSAVVADVTGQPEYRVVIIEDEPAVAEILRVKLEADGAEVHHSIEGLNGCALIGEVHPDVVVLDLLLPDMDGREICQLVRQLEDEEVSNTPILMLTALSDTSNREKGLSLGADDYVVKPFSVLEVTTRVRNLAMKRIESRQEKQLVREMEEKLREDRESESVLIHEIRNKLITISGLSSLLERKADELSVSEVLRYVKNIK